MISDRLLLCIINVTMKIRSMNIYDYYNVYEYWKVHYNVRPIDESENIKGLLTKNPGLSTIAVDDENYVIGTCLGSYDGRKAYIYKVSVAENLRGQGLGKKLVEETVRKLKEAGAKDIRVGCAPENAPFYEKCGFARKDMTYMQIKDY